MAQCRLTHSKLLWYSKQLKTLSTNTIRYSYNYSDLLLLKPTDLRTSKADKFLQH
jgi:hypothetical protein